MHHRYITLFTMEQVRDFSKRLHVPQSVGERALEYYRLSELKCSTVTQTSALALVCIEIACSQLGEPFEKKQAQKLSGLQHKAYVSAYHTVEKLLNLSSQVGLRELAVKFGCLEAEKLAEEILKSYESAAEAKYTAAQKEALDFSRPLYPAAALYTACKMLKVRCDKNKFQSAAMCARSVFQNVLEEMNKSAPQSIDEYKGKKRKQKGATEDLGDGGTDKEARGPRQKKARRETLHSRIESNPFSEEYLAWKDRVTTEARARIQEQS